VPFVDPCLSGCILLTARTRSRQERQGRAQARRRGVVRTRSSTDPSVLLRAAPIVVSHDLRTLIDDTLLEGELVGPASRPLCRQGLVDEHRSGREDRSKQIWQLLTLELWFRTPYRRSRSVRLGEGSRTTDETPGAELPLGELTVIDAPPPTASAGCSYDRLLADLHRTEMMKVGVQMSLVVGARPADQVKKVLEPFSNKVRSPPTRRR